MILNNITLITIFENLLLNGFFITFNYVYVHVHLCAGMFMGV